MSTRTNQACSELLCGELEFREYNKQAAAWLTGVEVEMQFICLNILWETLTLLTIPRGA